MAKAVKPVVKAEEAKAPHYVVAVEFRDKADFSKRHAVGADVSHFDAIRLQHLVNTGLVKPQ